MTQDRSRRESPPFKPDYSLITYLYESMSEAEFRAIMDGPEGPSNDEAAPEEAT